MSSDRPALGAQRTRHQLAFLALCLGARLALALAYSQIVPPWESYDEPGHFQYARYIAKYGRLLQPGDPEAEAIWSKFQPPLYYLLAAPALMSFDLGPTFQPPEQNPFFVNGNAGHNYAVTPDDPTGRERQTILALRAGRALGAVISTVSVIFIYLAARRLWPGEPGVIRAATVLYAFWPQFVFIGSMMTNDLLMGSLAAPITYLVIRLVQNGPNRRRLIGLSALIFAALLTKLNGIAFVPVALAAPLSSLKLHPPRRIWLALGGLTVIAIAALLLLSGMGFVTGQVFQLLTLQRFLEYFAAPPPQAGQPQGVWRVAEYGLRTFFASYGWGNLETFGWSYWVWYLAAGLALAGLARLVAQPRQAAAPGHLHPQVMGILGLCLASVIALSIALSISQSDRFLVVGRYWLPSLPAVSFLLVGGWRALLPYRGWVWTCRLAGLGVVLVSWTTLFGIIAPAYAKPQPVTAAMAATVDRAAAADFGSAIRLWGVVPPEPTVAGQPAHVTLCWEALAPIQQNYSLLLETVGPDGQGYGRRLTYPGDGNYATRLWAVGEPFCDRYEVPVRGDFPAPAVGALRVEFQTQPLGEGLAVTRLNGEALGQDVRVPIVVHAAEPPPAPTIPLNCRFGGQIVLEGYDIAPLPGGRGLRLTLHWKANAPVSGDYHVFAHLRDTPATAYAQSDQIPRRGAYPTNAWAVGERVLDEHDLTWLPDASPPPLTLVVGLYRPADGARLPVSDGQGNPFPNDEVTLALP